MRSTLGSISLQLKLTLTFMLILIPLVSVSMFANNYSQGIMNVQISDRTKGALLTSLAYMEQIASNMDQQTLLISSNPSIVNIWRDIEDPLNPKLLYDIHTVQQQLSSLTNINGAIQEAYIVHGASGNGVSTALGAVRWPKIKEEGWFQQVVQGIGSLVIYIPTVDSSEDQSLYLKDSNMYYIRLLDVLRGTPEPNVLIFSVNKSSLQSIIQHLQTTERMNISMYYNNRLIVETNPAAKITYASEMFTMKETSGAWSIQLEQPKEEIFKQSHRLQLFTYLIILISILLAVWTAWLIYIQILKPLRQLSSAFKVVSHGDLNYQIVHGRKDEFGFVMNGFNQMAESQRIMIEEDYEKELRLAKSEFSLLQSQINPHFLYNTLDSIYSVAVKYKMKEISEMVMNLAKFFRVSLGKGGHPTFTLEETIQHLLYYIRIQQMRTEHFTVEIALDKGSETLPVLKLLLQPIVENAIIHGIEKCPFDGELRIRSRIHADFLFIEVEDTGMGMPEALLAQIKRELSTLTSQLYRIPQESPSSQFFGLKNVKSRMKLYYGEEADVWIESEEGAGTKVTLLIPVRLQEGKGHEAARR
ncbi:sensor histidine kinase [Paenibacillus sp. HWE-109]|uniref:sensor histidine kinase n=1 Tax=Paenibacillus sp. HWE-109 TaxID=1306526 RepID=UPI001EE12918|nr:sensor histidine kinase [Paenibacillus sp. HWE-109]UKS28413.1 sensor histidine kinase [Paenibacillus sp. HWE-109]